MFKRSTKVTALLVAAASIMSIVPAMAATKLATKDGTVEAAVAFKDGKYLYEGYRTSDDDKALYFNAGDKDKKLDNADDLGIKFDKQEVSAFDGNDAYMVDLSTGKITDEDTIADLATTAQTKLDTKLSKANRYAKNPTINTFAKIDNNKFADVWYAYEATSGAATVYNGYTNAAGAYIDASYNANIYVYNGYKMVKIENVGDTETTTDGGVTRSVTLNSITSVATLGQDDKYIYRVVKANVTGAHKVKLTANEGTTDFTAAADYATTDDLYYVQKIAKAQGDTKDGASLPKSTDSYQIGGATGNGDVKDAFAAVMKLSTNPTYTDATAKATIVDGAIYVSFNDDNNEKVKTIKVVLRTSEKLDKYSVSTGSKLTDKVDGHVAKKDGDKDTKADAWTIDVDGNVWAIKDGEIKKSSKIGDFTTVYTCDRSLDRLDVYDESNLIAWDNSGDVYTTVTEGKKAASDEAATIVQPTTTPAKVGWDKLADGSWNFYDATGTKLVSKWANVGGAWYYLKADGVMATGWLNDNGTWYYLNGSGAMATGWLNDNGTWYYLNASGAMLANTVVDGYRLGASGAWVK